MNNADKYFEQQKQNTEFTQSYNEITQQVDIEWELERVKKHIENNYAKKTILQEYKVPLCQDQSKIHFYSNHYATSSNMSFFRVR